MTFHTVSLTERQREIVRDALCVAYADGDAPLFDRPEGEAELFAVATLFGITITPTQPIGPA